MKRKVLVFLSIVVTVLVPAGVWGLSGTYSNFDGNGGYSYTGAGASVDTNPKYDYSYTDSSCVGRFQKIDGTTFTQVFSRSGNPTRALSGGLWNGADCKQAVETYGKDAEGNYYTDPATPLAWARSESGPWNTLNIAPVAPLTPCQRIVYLDVINRCTEIPASSPTGFGTIKAETVSKQNAPTICFMAGNKLIEADLPGNWNLGVYYWNTNTLLCAREVAREDAARSTPTTTAPVTGGPVITVTTTTSPPVTTATTTKPTTTTTTTTAGPVAPTTTTTAPKPASTTTTTTTAVTGVPEIVQYVWNSLKNNNELASQFKLVCSGPGLGQSGKYLWSDGTIKTGTCNQQNPNVFVPLVDNYQHDYGPQACQFILDALRERYPSSKVAITHRTSTGSSEYMKCN